MSRRPEYNHEDDMIAHIDRLRAELAELRASRRWEYIEALEDRAEKSEAAIARVRELCVRYTSRAFPECMHAEEFLRALDGAE